MLDFIKKNIIFILIPISAILALLTLILPIVIFFKIFLTPLKNYDYQIKQDGSFYFTNDYYEKDNCIFFDNTKICGHYTIIRLNFKKAEVL